MAESGVNRGSLHIECTLTESLHIEPFLQGFLEAV